MTAIRGLGVSLLGLALLAGCQSGQFPDPNEDSEVLAQNPQLMRDNMADLHASLSQRVDAGMMDEERMNEIFQKELAKVLKNIPEKINPQEAWIYGDLYRDAKDWKHAYACYDIARKNAKNEDRRVNDNLRFAQAAAALDRVDEAIKAARSVFDAPAKEKAPILPATLYEIVPAGQGKKHDAELAKLLEDAIVQHRQTIVNLETEPGRMFLLAKSHHIELAWSKVISLYQDAGQDEEARAAVRRSMEMDSRSASV